MKGNHRCCAPWLIDNANTNLFPNNDSAYNIGQGMNEESGTEVITQHDNNEYLHTQFSLNLFPAQIPNCPKPDACNSPGSGAVGSAGLDESI